MADTIKITGAVHFRMEIDLTKLENIPVTNWRKICRFLRQNVAENQEAIGILFAWFPYKLREATADHIAAGMAYRDGYQHPDFLPRKQRAEANRKNKKLFAAVKDAEKQKAKINKLYQIFKEAF